MYEIRTDYNGFRGLGLVRIFVMIFGKWNPFGAFGGAMLFDALYCDDDCIRGRAVDSGADGVLYEREKKSCGRLTNKDGSNCPLPSSPLQRRESERLRPYQFCQKR